MDAKLCQSSSSLSALGLASKSASPTKNGSRLQLPVADEPSPDCMTSPSHELSRLATGSGVLHAGAVVSHGPSLSCRAPRRSCRKTASRASLSWSGSWFAPGSANVSPWMKVHFEPLRSINGRSRQGGPDIAVQSGRRWASHGRTHYGQKPPLLCHELHRSDLYCRETFQPRVSTKQRDARGSGRDLLRVIRLLVSQLLLAVGVIAPARQMPSVAFEA